MNLAVVSAEVMPRHLPLARAIGNSRATWRSRDGMLLLLGDGAGHFGCGEASPLPGYSADSLDLCREQLGRLRAALPLRLSLDGKVEDALRRWFAALPVSAPAARFALETALLDLLGRVQKVPLGELLGRSRGTLPLSALLNGDTPEQVVACARRALERGIGTVKLKIGRAGAFAGELATLRALRTELGDGLHIRLDANGAFSAQEATDRLAALAPLHPEFIEEPLAGMALAGWRSPVPLALDESLQGGAALAARMLEQGTCQVLVLKPMALGGLLACLDLARLAARFDAGVVVTHLFDGPVALAAAAELALALPGRVLACGLDRHEGLGPPDAEPEPDIKPDAKIEQIGENAIVAGRRPGHGVDPRAWS